ncbi:MAG: hypothetical protein ACK5MT_15670 [Actinomycetales bacterium]
MCPTEVVVVVNRALGAVQSLASAWHEGSTPNREDVENLTDEARGAIDAAEYRRRAHAAARREGRRRALMGFGTWESYYYPAA